MTSDKVVSEDYSDQAITDCLKRMGFIEASRLNKMVDFAERLIDEKQWRYPKIVRYQYISGHILEGWENLVLRKLINKKIKSCPDSFSCDYLPTVRWYVESMIERGEPLEKRDCSMWDDAPIEREDIETWEDVLELVEEIERWVQDPSQFVDAPWIVDGRPWLDDDLTWDADEEEWVEKT